MIFDGKPDNLHWVWDTGLLEHISRNSVELAAELESKITPQERADWDKGSIEDWVLEGTGWRRQSPTETWKVGIQRQSLAPMSGRQTR